MYLPVILNDRIDALNRAIVLFSSINDYKDSAELKDQCERLIYKEKETIKSKKRRNRAVLLICLAVINIAIIVSLLYINFYISDNYNKAEELLQNQQYTYAYDIYKKLGDYKDAPEKAKECLYLQALDLIKENKRSEANALLEQIKDYKDSADLIHFHSYENIASADPTCGTYGYKDYVCSSCNHSYREIFKATEKHMYIVLNSQIASCTEDGYNDYICTICNHSYREKVNATGHNYTEATCTSPKKCSTCGDKQGEALGHTTDSTKCSRCGTVTFKTITYTGSGSTVKSNIKLPKGKFRITCTMTSGSGNMTMYFNDGSSSYNDLIFNDYIKGSSEVTIISGPVNNGCIVINANDYSGKKMGWKIIIEAIC